MDEQSKRRFDAIAVLWKECWDRTRNHRIYEWKLCFALWGALGTIIALALTGKISGTATSNVIAMGGIGVLLTIAHWYWLKRYHHRQDTDRNMAIDLERILQELSGARFSEELEAHLVGEREKRSKTFYNWTFGPQFLVTLVLLLSAVIAVGKLLL